MIVSFSPNNQHKELALGARRLGFNSYPVWLFIRFVTRGKILQEIWLCLFGS